MGAFFYIALNQKLIQMKNKVLWKLVDDRTTEMGFESEDLKKIAMIEMYMSQMEIATLERIKKNVIFIVWTIIIGLISTLGVMMSLGSLL